MQLVLPQDVLNHSPSQSHVAASTELHHRVFGCLLIKQTCRLLQLPQNVCCTGQTLLHRFYYRVSLTEYNVAETAMCCVILAAKIEEEPRSVKDVLGAFAVAYERRRGDPVPIGSRLYMQWSYALQHRETVLLKELGFSLYNIMEHPHKYILFFCQIFKQGDPILDKALAQSSWNYLNDSMCLDFCVRFDAKVIASAAIYLAAAKHHISLPSDPPWWELFDVEHDQILSIAVCLDALHDRFDELAAGWIGYVDAPSIALEQKLLHDKQTQKDAEEKRTREQKQLQDSIARLAEKTRNQPLQPSTESQPTCAEPARSVAAQDEPSARNHTKREQQPSNPRDSGARRRTRSRSRDGAHSRARKRSNSRPKRKRHRSRSRDRRRRRGSRR